MWITVILRGAAVYQCFIVLFSADHRRLAIRGHGLGQAVPVDIYVCLSHRHGPDHIPSTGPVRQDKAHRRCLLENREKETASHFMRHHNNTKLNDVF